MMTYSRVISAIINSPKLSTHTKQPEVLLIEEDSWNSEMDVCFHNQLLVWKQNDQMLEVPKVILLVTSESDKAKAGSFVDTVINKPLRASTIAACFQQVLSTGKQHRKQKPQGSAFHYNLLVGKNILVVDDNKVNLRVAAASLKKYGAKVECAESGKDALSRLQLPHKFDACFMDVQMPEMDGFDATRQIRLLEAKAAEQAAKTGAAFEEGYDSSAASAPAGCEWHLPILAMSADVFQATCEECMKCGMDGYVSKPYDDDQLCQAVTKLFESKPMPDSSS